MFCFLKLLLAYPYHLTIYNFKFIFTLYILTACLFAKSPPKHTVLCMVYWVFRTPPTILTKSVLVFPSDNIRLFIARFSGHYYIIIYVIFL